MNFKLEDKDLETIPSKVCRILREAILRGELKPGQRLVQDELASSIGVSRMPVREAIRRLEAEGLVTVEPHRGAVVKSFSITDIEEVYQLRCLFEKVAVEESVKQMPSSVIDELENLVQIMEQKEDVEEFVQMNIEFHHLLISCCPWNRLNTFIESLWSGFPQQTPHILSDQIEQSHKEHRDILQAVKEKDAVKAAEFTATHINRAGKNIINNIKKSKQ